MLAMHLRFILLLTALWVLSACGFQLRGTANTQLSARFNKTYLVNALVTNDFFYQSIHQLIIANGGQIVDKQAALIAVNITPIRSSQRQIALSGNGALKEYERTFSTTVTLVDLQNNKQLGSREITTTRNIQLDDRLVLAGEEQSAIIRREAERALAQSIMRYLQSF